jgi:hypothetical protein
LLSLKYHQHRHKLGRFPSAAKITGSKNQELYEEYRKSARFRDDNLTLLEQKFNAIKK